MAYIAASRAPDGSRGASSFTDREEALAAGKSFSPGLVVVSDLDSSEWWIFRDGVEITGDEAAEAVMEFQRAG